MTTNDRVNLLLRNEKIEIAHFKELRFVGDLLKNTSDEEFNRIISFFRFVQINEIPGWRTKQMTQRLCSILAQNSKQKPVLFYELLCPSYAKGLGAFGFRIDGIGPTSIRGIKNLENAYLVAKKLGFFVDPPLAIFFDLAIEQYERVCQFDKLSDIDINAKNIIKELPSYFSFLRLTEVSELRASVGFAGLKGEHFKNERILESVILRGSKFYQLFGWNDTQIKERSIVVANSESYVAKYLKNRYPLGVMIYTPTMLERSKIYSPDDDVNPIPILFPK